MLPHLYRNKHVKSGNSLQQKVESSVKENKHRWHCFQEPFILKYLKQLTVSEFFCKNSNVVYIFPLLTLAS